jgi:hypothetical protein
VKEESRIVLKTLGARSFAAAQDDSIESFFRSLKAPPAQPRRIASRKPLRAAAGFGLKGISSRAQQAITVSPPGDIKESNTEPFSAQQG